MNKQIIEHNDIKYRIISSHEVEVAKNIAFEGMAIIPIII